MMLIYLYRTFLDIESDIIHIVTEHFLSRGDGNERTNAYMRKYEGNGFQEYQYIACGGADVYEVYKKMDGKVFSVKKIMPGVNTPPMHPNCHCSTAPYIDEKKYYEWLDSYDQHHMSYNDWVEWKNNEISRALAVRNGNTYGIKTINGQGVSNETKADLDKDIHKLLKEYPVLKGRISEISLLNCPIMR